MLPMAVPGGWLSSHGPVFPAGSEKEGPPRKKAGLASFRLSGLKSRDQGGHIAWGWEAPLPRGPGCGEGEPLHSAHTSRGGKAHTQRGSPDGELGSLAVRTEQSWRPS